MTNHPLGGVSLTIGLLTLTPRRPDSKWDVIQTTNPSIMILELRLSACHF